MQNREVPLGSLPIFFSSLRLAEAGRTCPEVRGGRQGAERGLPSAERRRRSHGHGAQETRVRGRGCGCGTRNTEDAGVGRGTQNAEHVDADADAGTGTGARGAGRRTQNTGYWPRAAEHGKRGHEVQKTEDAGTGCRTQNTGYWPRAAEHGKRGHGAQETGHRRRGTSPRAWTAARLHTPARPRNNLPGPFTAGRHPPRAAPYLSRVRIRITPLPPRTPYMLLPRCTSTDLTS